MDAPVAGTLSESGGAFPRHANTAFLGQFGDNRLPNIVYFHGHFARGYQVGRWSDADFVAYERVDRRENTAAESAAFKKLSSIPHGETCP